MRVNSIETFWRGESATQSPGCWTWTVPIGENSVSDRLRPTARRARAAIDRINEFTPWFRAANDRNPAGFVPITGVGPRTEDDDRKQA
jgi:hypothetical protein